MVIKEDDYNYIPLSSSSSSSSSATHHGRSGRTLILTITSTFMFLFILFTYTYIHSVENSSVLEVEQLPRSVSAGVSDKSNVIGKSLSSSSLKYPWTNSMLSWQRTSFHFQPQKNWMNGPLFYKGWYHLFYQYNPHAAIWGDIVWAHAVSKDLIHWLYLPFAMVPDQWYDINGVWTGSATFLKDGTLVMLYTGATDQMIQVQNLAFPANLSDPLLLNWVKYSKNPVLIPPPGIGLKDFRDPTTAWLTLEGKWRTAIGSKIGKTGVTLLYDTTDFKKFEKVDGFMHSVNGTGMWECVDFYPVSKTSQNGLDTSANGPEVKHVLKASMDDTRIDYYAIGSYDEKRSKWKPDVPEMDVGYGWRYDFGKFYASKSFYDQSKGRRILWGWIGESDSVYADISKGWSSVQSVPRTVLIDRKTETNLLQWPVEELESLRSSKNDFKNVKVSAGEVLPLHVGDATQLDIIAEFEVDGNLLESTTDSVEKYECSSSDGSAQRGGLGPFGLLVLSDSNLIEQTPVYFYIAKGNDKKLKTFFCADQSRSSVANDVVKQVFGSFVPVLEGEKLTMRILVDHSIIESFAQEGRVTITSRVYPTRAIYGETKLYLFNNATKANVVASVTVFQMESANIRPYPL